MRHFHWKDNLRHQAPAEQHQLLLHSQLRDPQQSLGRFHCRRNLHKTFGIASACSLDFVRIRHALPIDRSFGSRQSMLQKSFLVILSFCYHRLYPSQWPTNCRIVIKSYIHRVLQSIPVHKTACNSSSSMLGFVDIRHFWPNMNTSNPNRHNLRLEISQLAYKQHAVK